MNLVRAVSTEGFGRARYYREIRDRLDTDPQFPPYFEQESSALPQFYKNMVRQDLGPLMAFLGDIGTMEKPIKKKEDRTYAKNKKQPEQLEPEQMEIVTPEELNALLRKSKINI